MSKNVCSTCKHYERVNDNEPEDHGDCTLYPIWVDVWAAHYCGQWAAVKTAKEEAPTSELDIDWSQVPEGYDWAAQDEDGYIFAYLDKPTPSSKELAWSCIKSPLHLVQKGMVTNVYWTNTLTKRPVGK